MNDNEIIKAWEKILKIGHAPIGESWAVGGVVTTKLAKETLDMLYRQKGEIERLKEDYAFSIKLNGLLQVQRDGRDELINELDEKIDNLNRELQTAKSEAIKELLNALELKVVCKQKTTAIGYESAIIDIKNLLKEMVGDDNA